MHMFIYSKCFAGSSRKNVYTLQYAFIYQKSAYITIYTKTACTAHFFRCRQQCAHTCICILSQKSAHPTIHTNLPAAVMKRRQNAVLRASQVQVKGCQAIAGCRGSALALLLLFHYPHCAHNLPAIYPAAAPRSRLPATLPRCRAHKNKKKM